MNQVKPYGIQGKSKKEEVAQMFDNISGKYDFLNHTLSLGIDRSWRKKALKKINISEVRHLLDIATGTGDFAIAAKKSGCEQVTGIDISNGMLEVGREKVMKLGMQNSIVLSYGDSEHIPFPDNTFDAITVAFGVRNFEHLDKGLAEMYRVLKSGGTAVVLEFSKPSAFPIKQLYGFYFNHILPRLGKAVSGDKAAYSYLPESVNAFPEGEAFIAKLKDAGFTNCSTERVTFGIASIYTGTKK